jgi:hypothetical protein
MPSSDGIDGRDAFILALTGHFKTFDSQSRVKMFCLSPTRDDIAENYFGTILRTHTTKSLVLGSWKGALDL